MLEEKLYGELYVKRSVCEKINKQANRFNRSDSELFLFWNKWDYSP